MPCYLFGVLYIEFTNDWASIVSSVATLGAFIAAAYSSYISKKSVEISAESLRVANARFNDASAAAAHMFIDTRSPYLIPNARIITQFVNTKPESVVFEVQLILDLAHGGVRHPAHHNEFYSGQQLEFFPKESFQGIIELYDVFSATDVNDLHRIIRMDGYDLQRTNKQSGGTLCNIITKVRTYPKSKPDLFNDYERRYSFLWVGQNIRLVPFA